MDQEIIHILEMLVAIVAAIVAYWQHREKTQAVVEKEEAQTGMHLAEVQQWEAESERADVVSFFDPGDQSVTSPPDDIPARSWTMSDPTKRWLTFDHSPEEQQSLLRQVADAEEKGLTTYTLDLPSAWYEIEYGLIRSSRRKIPG